MNGFLNFIQTGDHENKYGITCHRDKDVVPSAVCLLKYSWDYSNLITILELQIFGYDDWLKTFFHNLQQLSSLMEVTLVANLSLNRKPDLTPSSIYLWETPLSVKCHNKSMSYLYLDFRSDFLLRQLSAASKSNQSWRWEVVNGRRHMCFSTLTWRLDNGPHWMSAVTHLGCFEPFPDIWVGH